MAFLRVVSVALASLVLCTCFMDDAQGTPLCPNSLQLMGWVASHNKTSGGQLVRMNPCTNETTVIAEVPAAGPIVGGGKTTVQPGSGAGFTMSDGECVVYYAPAVLKSGSFGMYSWMLEHRMCGATSSSTRLVEMSENGAASSFSGNAVAYDPVRSEVWQVLGNQDAINPRPPYVFVVPASNVSSIAGYIDLSTCHAGSHVASVRTVPSQAAVYVFTMECLNGGSCFEFYISKIDAVSQKCEWTYTVNGENNGALPLVTAMWPNREKDPDHFLAAWLARDAGVYATQNMTGPFETGTGRSPAFTSGPLVEFNNMCCNHPAFVPTVLLQGSTAVLYSSAETAFSGPVMTVFEQAPNERSFPVLNNWQPLPYTLTGLALL